MAGEYLIENLKRAEVRRQAVLDWLKQHPGAGMADIEDALSQFERVHLRGVVSAMIRRKEIMAEGKLKLRKLTAIASVTASAEELLAGKRLNSMKANCRRKGKTLDQARGLAMESDDADESNSFVQIIGPGRIRYLSGHTKPAHGSRGQGAVRERNTINCHQLY